VINVTDPGGPISKETTSMNMSTIRKAALFIGCFALCLATFLTRTSENAAAQTTGCIQFSSPFVTHGFARTDAFPNGDQFLVGESLGFTVVSTTSGASKLTADNASFGGNPGFPGTSPEGFTASTPNATVRALSCLSELWDINFHLATKGQTEGDMITLYLQNADGSKVVPILMFTIIGGKAVLTAINDAAGSVHLDDRLARGGNQMSLNFINMAEFSVPAGAAGNRTPLLTIAFTMGPDSPVAGCWRVGADIKRGSGVGMTSILFTDIVDIRAAKDGDENNPAKGLLGGLMGGFPSMGKCGNDCVACPPVSPGGGGPTFPKCRTICFQSDEYFRNKFECLTGRTFLCSVSVQIPGVNFNNPVNVCRNEDAVLAALRGGAVFGNQPRSPYHLFVQQYVAAQLALSLNASGVARTDALWGNLSCYNLPAGTLPVTLSNGVTIDGDSMLKDLFMQTQFGIRDKRQDDLILLGQIFLALNGDAFGYSTCNSVNQFN
jgi:hypothetical protein